MGNVRNHIVGSPKHPFIAPRNSEALWDGFDPFGKQRFGVITVGWVNGQMGEDDVIADGRIMTNQLSERFSYIIIKLSVIAHIKDVYVFVFDQVFQSLS